MFVDEGRGNNKISPFKKQKPHENRKSYILNDLTTPTSVT